MLFSIPKIGLEELEARIAKLNTVTQKLGLAPITYARTGNSIFKSAHITARYDIGVYKESTVKLEYVEVDILGVSPKIGNHQVQAYIEVVGKSFQFFPLIKALATPSLDVDSMTCAHCGSKRDRKYYYLIKDETTGESKLVGKSCLKDFTGHTSIDSIVAKINALFFDLANKAHEMSFNRVSREEYLASVKATSFIIAYVRSTGSQVTHHEFSRLMTILSSKEKDLSATCRKQKEIMTEYFKTYERECEDFYNEVVEYFSTPKSNTFENNIYLELTKEYVPARKAKFGLVDYAPMCYSNFVFKKIQRMTNEERKATLNFVGLVGEKITIDATYEGSKVVDGYMGNPSYIHLFKDLQGNSLVWFNEHEVHAEAGDSIILSGTVKSHTEKDGWKSTRLLRCKIQKRGEY